MKLRIGCVIWKIKLLMLASSFKKGGYCDEERKEKRRRIRQKSVHWHEWYFLGFLMLRLPSHFDHMVFHSSLVLSLHTWAQPASMSLDTSNCCTLPSLLFLYTCVTYIYQINQKITSFNFMIYLKLTIL